MPKNKPNAMLARYQAQLEAEYRQRLEINSEFDLIALMKTVHEDLQVGPGRAGKIFNDFLVNKLELAEMIDKDYGPNKHTGDKEILHTKKSYADLLRSIFSPADWKKARVMFPLLRAYWEE